MSTPPIDKKRALDSHPSQTSPTKPRTDKAAQLAQRQLEGHSYLTDLSAKKGMEVNTKISNSNANLSTGQLTVTTTVQTDDGILTTTTTTVAMKSMNPPVQVPQKATLQPVAPVQANSTPISVRPLSKTEIISKCIEQGSALLASGKIEGATAIFLSAFEDAEFVPKPLAAKLYYLSGSALFMFNDTQGALAAWDLSRRKEENSARRALTTRDLALAYAKDKQYEKAAQLVKNEVKFNISNHWGILNFTLAEVYEMQNNSIKATEVLEDILTKDYNDDDIKLKACIKLSHTYLINNDMDKHHTIIATGLKLKKASDDTQAAFFAEYGHGMALQKFIPAAILAYQNALSFNLLDETKGNLCLQLAIILKDNNYIDDAITTCKAALECQDISSKMRADLETVLKAAKEKKAWYANPSQDEKDVVSLFIDLQGSVNK